MTHGELQRRMSAVFDEYPDFEWSGSVDTSVGESSRRPSATRSEARRVQHEEEAVVRAPQLSSKDFTVEGSASGQRGDAMDIVISGLGWLSLSGAGSATLKVSAPLGTLKLARSPSLLPFADAREKRQAAPKHRTRRKRWKPRRRSSRQ